MFTFTCARSRVDTLIAGALLVCAQIGCGARTGFDAESIAGAFGSDAAALEDAAENASSLACSSFTTIDACSAGGCAVCANSSGWFICHDPNGGAIFEDDAGRELAACGNLAGNVVIGPLRPW